jgi:hypothetical protein
MASNSFNLIRLAYQGLKLVGTVIGATVCTLLLVLLLSIQAGKLIGAKVSMLSATTFIHQSFNLNMGRNYLPSLLEYMGSSYAPGSPCSSETKYEFDEETKEFTIEQKVFAIQRRLEGKVGSEECKASRNRLDYRDNISIFAYNYIFGTAKVFLDRFNEILREELDKKIRNHSTR